MDLLTMWTGESPHRHEYHNMPQRTPEWFAVRRNRISASEAGTALGLSPFKSPDRLLAEKIDPSLKDRSDSPAMAWGRAHESEALDAFLDQYERNYEAIGYITCGSWLGASPDGLLDDNGLIEIKTPYNQARKLRSIHDQPWYYAQVQVQLLCADREWCAFYQWHPKDCMMEIIPRDNDWLTHHVPLLRTFWQSWQDGKTRKGTNNVRTADTRGADDSAGGSGFSVAKNDFCEALAESDQ
jgi:putative phage-type endonuclease